MRSWRRGIHGKRLEEEDKGENDREEEAQQFKSISGFLLQLLQLLPLLQFLFLLLKSFW